MELLISSHDIPSGVLRKKKLSGSRTPRSYIDCNLCWFGFWSWTFWGWRQMLSPLLHQVPIFFFDYPSSGTTSAASQPTKIFTRWVRCGYGSQSCRQKSRRQKKLGRGREINKAWKTAGKKMSIEYFSEKAYQFPRQASEFLFLITRLSELTSQREGNNFSSNQPQSQPQSKPQPNITFKKSKPQTSSWWPVSITILSFRSFTHFGAKGSEYPQLKHQFW